MPTAVISEADMAETMAEDCSLHAVGRLKRPMLVFDINGEAVSRFASDKEFAAAMSGADIIHADGQFIVWVSRLLGSRRIPERTATTDFFHAAAARAAHEGLKFYLLGSTEDVNRRCARRMEELYPGLRIVGRRNGYFSREEEPRVCEEISASGADVVWVGLGKPKEQFFIQRNRHAIDAAWIVSCGGCFHYVAGDYRRAPLWMRKAGLEWLHRLLTGPRYLVRRYALTIPHALWLVVVHDVFRRPPARRPARLDPVPMGSGGLDQAGVAHGQYPA